MNLSKIVFSSSLTLFSFCSFAQTEIEEKVNEKKEIKLNVDLSQERISTTYKGVSLKDLINQLEKKLSIRKGEFESSDEFSKRIDGAAKSVKIQGFSIDSPIAITVNVQNSNLPYESFKYKYSADSNELSLFALAGNKRLFNVGLAAKPDAAFPGDVDIFDISRVLDKSSSYAGSNTFGATTQVRQYDFTKYGLISSHLNWLTFYRKPFYVFDEPAAARVPLSRATATKILPKLAAVIVFQPMPPFITYDYERQKPTRDYPMDATTNAKYLVGELLGIVFFSRADGSVIHRMPENFGLKQDQKIEN